MDITKHKKAIKFKWVYKTKLNSDGFVNMYKARLVIKGYTQIFRIDFSEIFVLVATLDIIRKLLALATRKISWIVGFIFQGQ